MSSYTPNPAIHPAHAYNGKMLVILGGYLNPTIENGSTQAFSLDLSVNWTAAAPAFNKLADSPPDFGVPSAITSDGPVVLVANRTVFSLSNFWSSMITNPNLGGTQTALNNTRGLSAIVNPATSDILIPAGYLPGNDMAVINLTKKTVTSVPMYAAGIGASYAADWNQALNGMVLLDIAGALHIYSTASQWSSPIASGTIPSPRNSACFVAAGNEMILFGGYSRESGSSLNDLYVLDTATMTWRAGTNNSIANSRSKAACAYANGYLIVWGGVNSGRTVDVISTSIPLLYHIKSNKWVTSYIAPQVPTSQPNPTNTNPGSSQPSGGTSNPNTPSPSNGGNNIATIAGVVVGLVVLLALGGLILFRRRRRRSAAGVQRINSNSGLDLNPMDQKNMDNSQKPTIETEVGVASETPHSILVMRGPQTQPSNSVYYKDEYSPTNTFSQLSQSTPRSPEENLARSQSSVSGSTAVSSRGNPQSLETPQSNGFNNSVSYPRPPQYGKYKSGVDTYSVVTQQSRQPPQLLQNQQHHEPQQYHEFQRYQPQQPQQPQQLQQSRDIRHNNFNVNNYPENTYSSYRA